MSQNSPVIRKCISCRKNFDRINLLRIINDQKLGITLNTGMGRSAYICKSKKCHTDSKIRKKLQKALKSNLEPEFFDLFEREIANYK